MNDGNTRSGSPPPLTPTCVAVGRLLPLLDADELTESEAADVREHVATCARCQSRIAGFAVVEDALRRHYGEPGTSQGAIALADVISTADIDDEIGSIERRTTFGSSVRRDRLPSLSSVFGTLAAVLVMTLLAALLLSQMATRIGNQHPRPMATAFPLFGGKKPLSITTFDYFSTASVLNGIVTGPDGNLWVANEGLPPYPGSILRITPDGTMSEYWLANGHLGVKYIAVGPDGNLWFTEDKAIGRITPHGTIMEFPLPATVNYPNGIASGPDGNIWFTATDTSGNGVVGRVTPTGKIAAFSLPTATMTPNGIVAGPDGALWFTEVTPDQNGRIGRITAEGTITEFPIPTAGSAPTSIIAGPDGKLWFTETGANTIGRITTAGAMNEYSLPTTSSVPAGIIVGPDHALWFIESGNGPDITSIPSAGIGRISTGGVITEFSLPSASNFVLAGITFDPSGRLWMTFGQTTATVAHVDAMP